MSCSLVWAQSMLIIVLLQRVNTMQNAQHALKNCHFIQALCSLLGTELEFCGECLFSALFPSLTQIFHVRTSKVSVAFCVCCFTQDIPSHFSPYVISNIHHFLHCCAKTWQDRQMSVLCELMGGGCVCCWDVTRQSDINQKVTWPISLEHGWELPRQQISSVDEGWC